MWSASLFISSLTSIEDKYSDEKSSSGSLQKKVAKAGCPSDMLKEGTKIDGAVLGLVFFSPVLLSCSPGMTSGFGIFTKK